ncbi:hypothetical protein A2U01_0057163, partial [Trifolium medium]|nr:hypothetical protein [Trifolium medium]
STSEGQPDNELRISGTARNLSARLQDCVMTSNNDVTEEGDLVDLVFYAESEPVNLEAALKD